MKPETEVCEPLYLQAMHKPWVRHQLHSLLSKPGHAWLLAGAAGLNQLELAMAMAAGWLCEQPQAHGVACGQCASCHMLAAHTHPDLKVLLPEEMVQLLYGDVAADGADEEGKKRKPSREIRIEALRQAINFTQQTSARPHGLVVVIYPAERMNVTAANTLLKTLEEPPGQTRFILASENPQRLLATIRSRCLLHMMRWPFRQEALAWLEANGVAHPQIMLAAAGGRPEQAYNLHLQGLDASRWQQIPQQLQKGQAAVFDGLLPSQMLDIASKLCHDLLVVQAGGKARFFPQEKLSFISGRRDLLSQWSKDLMRLSAHAEHPWSVALFAQALAAKAAMVITQ